MDLKADPKTREKFIRFRRWVNDVAKANASVDELDTQVRWLLYDYETHMKAHEARINRGVIETVVVGTAEFLEDIVKVRFGKLAKALFSISTRQEEIDYLDLKVPGRELAYISHIEKRLPADPEQRPAV